MLRPTAAALLLAAAAAAATGANAQHSHSHAGTAKSSTTWTVNLLSVAESASPGDGVLRATLVRSESAGGEGGEHLDPVLVSLAAHEGDCSTDLLSLLAKESYVNAALLVAALPVHTGEQVSSPGSFMAYPAAPEEEAEHDHDHDHDHDEAPHTEETHAAEAAVFLYSLALTLPPTAGCLSIITNASALGIANPSTGLTHHIDFHGELVLNAPPPSLPSSEVAGTIIGAVTVVVLIPFFAVLLMLALGPVVRASPCLSSLRDNAKVAKGGMFLISSFGCGALLGIDVFHVYPEALAMSGGGWSANAILLSAIVFLAIIHVTIDLISGVKHEHVVDKIVDHDDDEDEETPTTNTTPSRSKSHEHDESNDNNAPVVPVKVGSCSKGLFDLSNIGAAAYGVCVGDALHNAVDGIVIAVAFISCSASAGWLTVGVVCAHEIPQELADFAVVINNGATVAQACVMLVLAQVSAYVGALVIIGSGVDAHNETSLGLLLMFTVGVFLYVSLTDMLPPLLRARKSWELACIGVGFFLGLLVVGLALSVEEVSCT